MHLICLHDNGSTNPVGITSNTDRIPFHPYYSAPSYLIFSFRSPATLSLEGNGLTRLRGANHNSDLVCRSKGVSLYLLKIQASLISLCLKAFHLPSEGELHRKQSMWKK